MERSWYTRADVQSHAAGKKKNNIKDCARQLTESLSGKPIVLAILPTKSHSEMKNMMLEKGCVLLSMVLLKTRPVKTTKPEKAAAID
eukprot:CAMPEP_0185009522 /NCGR_PEP_ID=MMETSP1098-20130426/92389_1 /TAXON_ID=89044 /ORGANISM="Spumella elongata, Strain CCAP 955/1" /LENGTH=86 /DNA_ID=CAMNT_0027538207 /DNA_START=170 /DNA_END=427 /DNA_ORIENTATION=-